MRRLAAFFVAALAYSYLTVAPGSHPSPSFDSAQYVAYGSNLLSTGTYGERAGIPDMNREPAYGSFLAASFWTLRALGVAAPASPEALFFVRLLQSFLLFSAVAACAFFGEIPGRIRWPLFWLGILSPTTIGVARDLYSEAIAVPLSFLLLLCASRGVSGRKAFWLLGAASAMAALVLTRSMLAPAAFLSAGLGLLAWSRPERRAVAPLCFALFAGGFGAQKSWDFRNQLRLGENVDQSRRSNALAGKIARLDRMELPRELPVALAASIGTNFCDGIFGAERCSLFDIRGCDEIGFRTIRDYRSRFATIAEADRRLTIDMLRLYLHRPLVQLLGSALELLRMSLFEAVHDAGSLPGFLRTPARAWHLFGSLLFWALILLAWLEMKRTRRVEPAAQLCLLFIAYHLLVMSQVTNLVRYVFPILPFLYYFVADGSTQLTERITAWRRSS